MSNPIHEAKHPSAQLALLDQARKGELPPDEADELSPEQTGEGLGKQLPPEEYHAAAATYWSAPMVLAWISWRIYGEVREWDARYLTMCRYWAKRTDTAASNEGAAYDLCVRHPPNSDQFESWGHNRLGYWPALNDGKPAVLLAVDPERSRSTLWGALSAGDTTAFGLSGRGGARIEIPRQEWVDLEVRVGPDGLDEFFYRHAPTKAAYLDVQFVRADVEECWPSHGYSDPSGRDEIGYWGIPADPELFRALYTWIEQSELTGMRPPQLGKPKRRGAKDRDFAALCELNEQRLENGGQLMTYADTDAWANRLGIGREQMRKLRKRLPPHLKRGRGQRTE